jgi:hypothetical protein
MRQTAVENDRFPGIEPFGSLENSGRGADRYSAWIVFVITRTLVVLVAVISSATGFGQTQTFHKTQMFDSKGLESIDLSFDQQTQRMTVQLRKVIFTEVVPYAAIDKLSYQVAAHRRVSQGTQVIQRGGVLYFAPPLFLLPGASLIAASVVMLTSEKNHWFYVDYKQDGIARHLALKLDKSEYKQVLKTSKEQTGKNVEILATKK